MFWFLFVNCPFLFGCFYNTLKIYCILCICICSGKNEEGHYFDYVAFIHAALYVQTNKNKLKKLAFELPAEILFTFSTNLTKATLPFLFLFLYKMLFYVYVMHMSLHTQKETKHVEIMLGDSPVLLSWHCLLSSFVNLQTVLNHQVQIIFHPWLIVRNWPQSSAGVRFRFYVDNVCF